MTAARAEFEKMKSDIYNQGREATLRAAILDMCELLGVAASDEQRARLERMPLAELERVRLHLKQSKTLPA